MPAASRDRRAVGYLWVEGRKQLDGNLDHGDGQPSPVELFGALDSDEAPADDHRRPGLAGGVAQRAEPGLEGVDVLHRPACEDVRSR
jgi:hypothetical protein